VSSIVTARSKTSPHKTLQSVNYHDFASQRSNQHRRSRPKASCSAKVLWKDLTMQNSTILKS